MDISKEQFVSVIESMRLQHHKDKEYADMNDVRQYDNSKLYRSLIDLLRIFFPGRAGFCHIENYCFLEDFGKFGEEYESPEQLYDRLMKEKNG